MNLRHIDPRSIDWNDAMLDWETEGRSKRERVADKVETKVHPLVASQASSPDPLASRPPASPR